MNNEELRDGVYGLSSLSEKTRESNHLQMLLQRQHFLLSYLNTLGAGSAKDRTHNLMHGSPTDTQSTELTGGRLFCLPPYDSTLF